MTHTPVPDTAPLTFDVTFTEAQARQVIRAIDKAWAHCNVQGKREFQPLHDLAATLKYGLQEPDPPAAA